MLLPDYRQQALAFCAPACPRLFRARQEEFLLAADTSFLPPGWQWPEGGIFTGERAGSGLLLRLTDKHLLSLPVPALTFDGYDGTARRELLRIFALHPGAANGQNAFFYYALLKAKEENRVEETCARLLPRAAESLRLHAPLPSIAAALLM